MATRARATISAASRSTISRRDRIVGRLGQDDRRELDHPLRREAGPK